MPLDLRIRVLMALIRVFDLIIVCACFLASMAFSAGSLTWPSLAEVLVIRIKVGNIVLFVGYLALCSAILAACALYRSHRLSQAKQRLYEIFLAVNCITGVLLLLKPVFFLAFATTEFFCWFWILPFGSLLFSHEIALYVLHLARLYGRNLRNVIIVGEGPEATALANRVSQEVSLGYRVLRTIDARGTPEDG